MWTTLFHSKEFYGNLGMDGKDFLELIRWKKIPMMELSLELFGVIFLCYEIMKKNQLF